MDKTKKLQDLLDILNEWIVYSKLWNEVSVTIIIKKQIETAEHWNTPDEYGGEVTHTKLGVKKIEPTEYVMIKYFNPKKSNFEATDYESIEFPYEDINKRLEHYRNKVKIIKSKINGNVEL